MARQQSDRELIGHLANQLRFLRNSGVAFDAGDNAEAMRMAVAVRILCHETPQSRAPLNQLGLLQELKFVDTVVERLLPPVRQPEGNLEYVTVFNSPLAPMGSRGLMPQLQQAEQSLPKPFATWWNAVVLEAAPDHMLSRRDIVLSLANQDGGAHVDPSIKNPAYLAISRDGALGDTSYTTPEGEVRTVEGNQVLGVMRQIAYEVERTLAPFLGN